MRAISAGLQTFLDGNNKAIVRHLLTITLSSGTVVRWTDHSANITISGNTWLASGSGTVPLVKVGKRRDPAGTEVGELEVILYAGEGAQLAGMRLPLAAISDGFDGATVRVDRVYGPADLDLALGVLRLFDGRIGEIEPSSSEVVLSLVDAREDLKVQLPRTGIQPACSASHYDAQCGLSIGSWTVSGTVASGSTAIKVRSNRTEADGYFDLGVLTFTSGANSGYRRAVRAYLQANGEFELDEALPAGAPSAGDTFTVYPGCDKRWATCKTKYTNSGRYRGFPLMPSSGNDARSRGMRGAPTPGRSTNVYGWVPPFPLQRSGYLPDPIISPPDDPLPIVYGKNLVDGTLIYRAGPTDSTNVCDLCVGFCEGPIQNVGRAWINGTFYSSIRDLDAGGSVLFLGTRPTQTHWSRFTLTEPDYLTGFPGVAYWASPAFRLPIGDTGNYRFEVNGFLCVTPDADPAGIIADTTYGILNNTAFGAGFTWPVVVDTGPDGLAASSARRYYDAARIVLSPVIAERRAASEILRDILDACNSSCRMSDGSLEIIPLGDVEFTGTSLVTNLPVTYTPYTTAQYAFTESSYLTGGDEDPISVRRIPRAEVYNICPVEFTERSPTGETWNSANCYQSRTVEDPEPVDVAAFGPRRSGSLSFPMITLPSVALTISRIKAQRSVKRRNTYSFKVGYRYAPLEPLDYVVISDAHFGIANRVVRVTSIEEDETGVITIEAEDAPYGISHAVAHTVQSNESDFPGSLFTQPAASDLWNVPDESVKERHIAPGAVTGGKIADDAVTEAKINAAAVSAAKIMAGVVDATKLAEGQGLNILPNGDFSAWDSGGSGIPKGWTEWTDLPNKLPSGANLAGGSWSLLGNVDQYNGQYLNTPYLHEGAPAGGNYDDWNSPAIPVVAGKRYAASVYAGAHRARGKIYIGWYDSAGTWFGHTDLDLATQVNDEEATGGTTIAGYKRIYTVATAPTGATSAKVALRKYATKPAQTDSYLFLCRAQFEEVGANAAGPGPWVPPAANIITAERITAGAITAGKIAAGAVGADKIAANSITAKSLVLTNFDNLWPNPTAVLAPPDGYTVSATDPEFGFRHQDYDHNGTWGWHRRLAAGGAEVDAFLYLPAIEGDRFYLEWWGRRWTSGNTCGMAWDTLAADGTTYLGWHLSAAPTSETWAKYSGVIGPLPAGSTRLLVYAFAQANVTMDVADIYLRRMAEGNLIVDGAITANKIAANVIKTPNYTFSGSEGEASEVATAGAKMQNTPAGVALLAAMNGVKFGPNLFSELWSYGWRSVIADGSTPSFTAPGGGGGSWAAISDFSPIATGGSFVRGVVTTVGSPYVDRIAVTAAGNYRIEVKVSLRSSNAGYAVVALRDITAASNLSTWEADLPTSSYMRQSYDCWSGYVSGAHTFGAVVFVPAGATTYLDGFAIFVTRLPD